MEDIVRRFLLRVGLDVDLAQIFVQLRQRHLDSCLHGVDVDRRQLRARCAAGHGELIGEHEFHQLGQHAVLGAEDILEDTVGDRRLLHNLGDGGFFIALLKKQLDTDRQNPLLGRQACTCDCDEVHFPSSCDRYFVYIVANPQRKRKGVRRTARVTAGSAPYAQGEPFGVLIPRTGIFSAPAAAPGNGI